MRNDKLLLTAAVALVAACASPTPYEPAEGGDTGYTTSQVDSDTYRVTFEGNEATSRETVETYLLYRAAQITQESGNEYFAFIERGVDEDVDVDAYQAMSTTPGFYGPGYGFGGFSYYSTFPYGPGVGTGFGAGGETVVTTEESYDAHAMIEVFPTEPMGDTNALNASEVIANLEDEIRRPGEEEPASATGSDAQTEPGMDTDAPYDVMDDDTY